MKEDDNKNKKKVILIVDDDAMLLGLYERMFDLQGVETLVAQDGEAGLKIIQDKKPDFVILDVRMPKLGGIEVLKRIRVDENIKETPVLVLTNFDDYMEYREEAKKLGVVDFLSKINIDPAEIVKFVVDYISKNKKANSKN